MSFLDLHGRVSVITGGSRGIGAATAEELARAGSDIALFDLHRDEAREVAKRIATQFGVRGEGYAVDVRDAPLVDEMFAQVASDFGAVDHLVNNAGVQFISPIDTFPTEKWDSVTGINLDGVFFCTRAAWSHLRTRGRGRIVNIASVHGIVASEFKPAYVAAKHGVVGLTRAAALEGAPLGITVNAVAPGAVLTDLVKNQAPDLARSYGVAEEEALERAFLSAMPSKRFVEPVEVAQLCVYLCSDAARSINGATISIDGGWAAH